MALSVLKPGGAIHPVVGSIFSAPRAAGSFEPLGEVENVPTGDEREVLHESVSAVATSSAPESRPRATAPAIEDESPASLIATPQSVAGFMLPIAGRAGSENPGLAGSKVTDQNDRRAESSASGGETAAISAKRPYAPLISAALAPSPPPPSLVFPGRPEAGSSQPFASQPRASDDIEIHIGRIEVAAVHPAPARTAPARPQRRAASLDEYLKRRDGRPS